MASNSLVIQQQQGQVRVNRKINPTAGHVLGFDSSGHIADVDPSTLTITSDTLTTPIIAGGLTASGSGANDFSASTGTFKTSSGANTLSGDVSVAANKDIVYATGDGVFDASLGTGVFKTTTGANTISGDATIAANKNLTAASGTTAVDFSAASGTFKTSTGTHTIGGAVNTAFDVTFTAANKGTILKQGSNGRVGTFVANGATPVTVSNTSVAISDAIVISLNTVGGTVGVQPHVATITGGSGFTVLCTASDTSTYNYALIKNAA